MWYWFQALIVFAAGSGMIYLGAKDGRAIGVVGFIVAFLVMLFIGWLRSTVAKARERRALRRGRIEAPVDF